MTDFEAFPKIPRYRRELAISEKIDGTNAAVRWLPSTGSLKLPDDQERQPNVIAVREIFDQHGKSAGEYWLLAQSRTQFIIPGKDNYAFAKWVSENVDELAKLGPGAHFGEWWGYGIQRGYGAPEKRFSLFNYQRWGDGKQERPACCGVVPFLGYVQNDGLQAALDKLRTEGSVAFPGYMKPEGIVVYHSQSRQLYKVLLEGDDVPKGKM